ncbi:MAG: Asp/Glu/hydantoin racemase [Enterovirga sp.]|nr:Asp/Glu/hydantoin racemase [Enterovirga sp.]
MRLLLINPNTTENITELLALRARDFAGPGVEIRAVSGRFGARYIASRAAAAIAGHAALEALAEHQAGCDAVLLACFGDPGLWALKELSPVPVVGMAEASCHLACLSGRQFSIVTGGERWAAMLREFVASLGLSSRLASIRTVAPTGAEIAAELDRALAMLAASCRACAEEDGAEAVILGGAGLAGLAGRIASGVPVPVICSLEAGIRATIAAAELRLAKATGGSLAGTPAVASAGLSEALAAMLDPGR